MRDMVMSSFMSSKYRYKVAELKPAVVDTRRIEAASIPPSSITDFVAVTKAAIIEFRISGEYFALPINPTAVYFLFTEIACVLDEQ